MGEKSRDNFPTNIVWCKECGEIQCICKKVVDTTKEED